MDFILGYFCTCKFPEEPAAGSGQSSGEHVQKRWRKRATEHPLWCLCVRTCIHLELSVGVALPSRNSKPVGCFWHPTASSLLLSHPSDTLSSTQPDTSIIFSSTGGSLYFLTQCPAVPIIWGLHILGPSLGLVSYFTQHSGWT